MPEQAQAHLPDITAFRTWKPEYQAKALALLQEAENTKWRPFFCGNPACDGDPHDEWDFQHARSDQRPPKWSDDWLTLLFSGGRGSGKTRSGSEITHKVTEKVGQIILVAATSADIRETLVEGPLSGLLVTAPPGKRPQWEPSKKKLTWPNGAVARGFSAEEPDRLRGPESGFIWADEPAHWDNVEECWTNMQFGLRVKGPVPPKIVATTTPLPTKWMRNLVKEPDTVVRRVSTYANLVNLAEPFKKVILAKEGTRLGRQEIHGELLEDVEGALWNWDMFQWVEEAPDLTRIVVGVDPAGTTNRRSDETGIVTVGIGDDKCLYVLGDLTGKYSPEQWARKANGEYDDMMADAIVPEKTYGQDMVRFTLENAGYKGARIIPVESRRGKAIRAEPIVALYEKKKVFHVRPRGSDSLSALEDELTSWVPGGKFPSPNRLDALVHAATELAKHVMPASFANPVTLLRNWRNPGGVS
jgi:phage terminase large subunit-like protein